MTFRYFCGLLLLSAACAHSQVAIQDAVKLRAFVVHDTFALAPAANGSSAGKDSALAAILVNYLNDAKPIPVDMVLETFSKNPFMGSMFLKPPPPSLSINSRTDMRPDARTVQSASSPISRLGSIDVTALADGAVKFLIHRARQELTTAYFERMKRNMAGHPELAVLFPATHALLGDMSRAQYAKFLPALRDAFRADLHLLNTSLLELRGITADECRDDEDCRKRVTEIQAYFNSGSGRSAIAVLILFNQLSLKENLANALSTAVRDSGSAKENSHTLMQILKTAELFSQSLRGGPGSVWIKPQDLKRELEDTVTLKLYLGLVYQRAATDSLRIGADRLADRLASVHSDLKPFIPFLEKVLSKTEQPDSPGTSEEQKYRYAMAAFDFARTAADFSPLKVKMPDGFKAGLERFGIGVSLYRDIRDRNYLALVLDANRFLPRSDSTQDPLPESFLVYGSFIASVAKAETSDEVSAAIEAAVLPPGSFTTKRDSKSNLALNAYVGGFYGFETTKADLDRNKYSFGVWTPIGIAWSRGTKCGYSHSLFATIVDLGALTAFRLENGDSATLPDVHLKNIWAPGAYYMLGLHGPVSIGMGAQIAPSLRKISVDGVTEGQSRLLLRYSLTVSVDIPLFDFITNPRDD